MSKHTKGPWRVEKDLDCFDIKTDQQTVAMLDDNGSETEANSKLIASSPELLAACKGAIAALSQNKTFPADIKAAKEFLQNAINKVEGRD